MSTCHPTALITGITGQDGGYLAEQLLARGLRVCGLVISQAELEEFCQRFPGEVQLDIGDMTNAACLADWVTRTRPNEVYHLAALSHVGRSFELPVETCDVTGLGTVRLLEAVRQKMPSARFCNASSAAIFGASFDPLSESSDRRPSSPYGVAKLMAHTMVETYRAAHGLFACNAILFNHESPRRGPSFVTRKITQGIARLARDAEVEPLRLGNVDAKRDWGWAPDYTTGMQLMLQQDKPRDYVLATGQTRSVREFASLAASAAGMTLEWEGEGVDMIARDRDSRRIIITIDPQFYRPEDQAVPVGNPSRALRELDWAPTVSFEQMVAKMVQVDLEALDSAGK
jgi:GDPmannose 4,6-dehydratase